MGAIHFCGCCGGVVAVVASTFGAVACDGGDDVGLGVDFAYGLVFGIDDVGVAFGADGDSFGPIQGGLFGIELVACVPLFTGTGDVF